MRLPHKHYTPNKRKNFLPTLLFIILLWLMLFGIIYFLSPNNFFFVILFFLTLTLALTFTLSIILGNTRRGVIISISLSLFLILRYLGIGSLLNFILILAITVLIELYFNLR